MILLVGLLVFETAQGTGGGGLVGRFFLEITELFDEHEAKLELLEGGAGIENRSPLITFALTANLLTGGGTLGILARIIPLLPLESLL